MKRKRLDKWEKWNEREKIEKDGRREKMGKVGEMEGGRGSEEAIRFMSFGQVHIA